MQNLRRSGTLKTRESGHKDSAPKKFVIVLRGLTLDGQRGPLARVKGYVVSQTLV